MNFKSKCHQGDSVGRMIDNLFNFYQVMKNFKSQKLIDVTKRRSLQRLKSRPIVGRCQKDCKWIFKTDDFKGIVEKDNVCFITKDSLKRR